MGEGDGDTRNLHETNAAWSSAGNKDASSLSSAHVQPAAWSQICVQLYELLHVPVLIILHVYPLMFLLAVVRGQSRFDIIHFIELRRETCFVYSSDLNLI